MALDILAGVDWMQGQAEQGRTRFADKLLGQAYSAQGPERQSALGRLAGVDGQMAMAADTAFTQRDRATEDHAAKQRERQLAEVVNRAKILKGLPPQHRGAGWQQMASEVSQLVGDPSLANMPYDPATFDPLIDQLAGADDDNLPSSVREAMAFRADPSLLDTRRKMYESFSWGEVENADGTKSWVPRGSRTASVGTGPGSTGGGQMPTGPQDAPQGPPPGYDAGDVPQTPMAQEFSSLFPNARVTSTYRDPAHNDDVGGVSNSYHTRGGGLAIDAYPSSPQELAQIEQWAASQNLEVIKYRDGRIHVEPAPGGAQAAAGGGMVPTSYAGGGMPSGSPVAPPAQAGRFGGTYEDKAQAAARQAELEARARKTAELQLDLQYAPELAAAAAAQEAAKRTAVLGADRADTQVTQNRALTVYQSASKQLRERMAQTTTGPVAGRLPAVTASAQIAEGSRAQMAPILKSLFRSSGEGVFTDKDQALLMDMLPDRGDHPETVTAKMDAIDALVTAKLSNGAAAAGDGDDLDALIQEFGG